MGRFEDFALSARPALRRAYFGVVRASDVDDAVSSALEFGWKHWDRVSTMEHPIGYLFRVGQSGVRRRRVGHLPSKPQEIPDIEPKLVEALRGLPRQQRIVVWLLHGCQWTHGEIGEALEISPSTVSSHNLRGLATLRTQLGDTR